MSAGIPRESLSLAELRRMVGAIFLRLAVVGTTIYGAPKKDTITWNSCSTKEFYWGPYSSG